MRKTIELPFQDDEVVVDVDWKIIEVVERVFGVVADLVASDTLVNNPTRYQVAEVMCEWIRSKEYRRKDIREYVMTCKTEILQQYIGAIQGAILFSLSYIEEDDLDKLTQGEDLEAEKDAEEPEKKTAKKKSRSRGNATKSQ